VTAFAVDFDLDEVIGDGFRKTENSRRRFMDLAKRSLAAGVDTGTRTVAGARAEVPGDQGIFRRGAGSRACRHAGADFPEPPHLAGSVTQEQRVEDIEAQQAGSAVVGQRVFVERLENLPPKPRLRKSALRSRVAVNSATMGSKRMSFRPGERVLVVVADVTLRSFWTGRTPGSDRAAPPRGAGLPRSAPGSGTLPVLQNRKSVKSRLARLTSGSEFALTDIDPHASGLSIAAVLQVGEIVDRGHGAQVDPVAVPEIRDHVKPSPSAKTKISAPGRRSGCRFPLPTQHVVAVTAKKGIVARPGPDLVPTGETGQMLAPPLPDSTSSWAEPSAFSMSSSRSPVASPPHPSPGPEPKRDALVRSGVAGRVRPTLPAQDVVARATLQRVVAIVGPDIVNPPTAEETVRRRRPRPAYRHGRCRGGSRYR
jgi:hypothetical protein